MALPAHAVISTEFVHGTVTEVVQSSQSILPGTEIPVTEQTLTATLDSGEVVSVYNDRIPMTVGDRFYASANDISDTPAYIVHDIDRTDTLIFLVFLFAVVTAYIGRAVGVRALVSLVVSLVLILYVLVPLLVSGYEPVFVSAVGAAAILAGAMGITHGVGKDTIAAFLAAMVAVFAALVLGELFVHVAHLTGFSDDVANILNVSTGNTLNMKGLLLGGLIIGVLGIVDDLAVTQVATVSELRTTNASLTDAELYTHAMHVGREHLGAVVNTLVLAYAGAALPLLLLFTLSDMPSGLLINSEVVAVEIVRAAVGGIALTLVIPVATYLGIWLKPTVRRGRHHHH
jgi:uncharacterized membrane protein